MIRAHHQTAMPPHFQIDPQIRHAVGEGAMPPHFQIDPQHTPLFRILQQSPTTDAWLEVGYVWTLGPNRTSSTEHWYLYASAPTGVATRAAYAWPGYDLSGKIIGTTLRLEPFTPPSDQLPETFKAHLEQQHGVTITYVKGTMSHE
jgi:hypothetical protein